jgi:hypothetical protein
MKIKKRVLFFHFLFFLILSSAFLWPQFYYLFFLLFFLLFAFFAYNLRDIGSSQGAYFYFILAFIFLSSLFFYSSLLLSSLSALAFLLLGLIFSFYYFKELRNNLSRESSLKKKKTFIWVDTLRVLSVFLLSSFAYSLNYFINIENYLILTIIIFVLFFSAWQSFSVHSLDRKRVLLFSFVLLLSLLPVAWTLFSLPFNYNFLGLLLLLCYYIAQKLMSLYLSASLSARNLKYNLIFIISLLVFVFLITDWL